MARYAVFSCLGLGDGLIALVLSNNLFLNGSEVTTFHPFLKNIQEWFPYLPIVPFPSPEEFESAWREFDHLFFIYEKSSWMQAILSICQKKCPQKITILNPIATSQCNYAYWEQGRFDGNRSFVENLYHFCKKILKFTVVTKSNGILIPDRVMPKQFENRVIFHPSSSRPGKNWPAVKYLNLATQLKSYGFQPAFILTQEERQDWDVENIEAPLFSNPSEMVSYICESRYMIGNDSGVGHLASCLGLPTLTICRSKQSAKFWRPAWAPGKVITPFDWIPNLKGLRWRDRYWKKWISVDRVLKKFIDMSQSSRSFF